MNESHRGEDGQTREEALRDIGKDLELGQPLQEDDDHDLLLNLFDSIPLSTNNRKGKGIESQCECQSTEAEDEHSCMGKQEGDSPSKRKLLFREVRNLSERKRRGKITKKFQQLQKLLQQEQGNSEVSQASILDGAITHIKSTTVLLQMLAKMSPENAKVIEQHYSCNKFA